jgi:glutamine amidotransferase
MIVIVDYGMGNIHSVQKAIEFFKVKALVTNKPQDISNADKVILPGVGAFKDAMEALKKYNLIRPLIEHINNKKPFLGICLGMQLLFQESQEAEGKKGLAILKGEVVKFKDKKNLKIPHIGWNCLNKPANKGGWVRKQCPLLEGVEWGDYVYFCHSYYPKPVESGVVAAATDYGTQFTSVVWQDNVYGVQFHPEKSQRVGLRILENFVNL